jgi:hypothetical protein
MWQQLIGKMFASKAVKSKCITTVKQWNCSRKFLDVCFRKIHPKSHHAIVVLNYYLLRFQLSKERGLHLFFVNPYK